MKKLLLFFASFAIIGSTMTQVVFSVESPTELQGAYDMTYASGGDWMSMPDMLNSENAVQEVLALYRDQSEADTLACMQAANAEELAGKIAFLYRGECQFGQKALNAQDAGAIAVVIVNNAAGGPVGMAAGDVGGEVSIPTVMISDIDGATIRNAMNNGPVEVFIGNKTGFYANDVGTTQGSMIRAQKFAVHTALAQSADDFQVEVGGWMFNYGFNDQTNVRLNATIIVNDNEIYNESSAPMDMAAGDSAFIELPLFAQDEYPVGYYHVTYKVESDSIDDYDFDNTVTADFAVNDKYFSFSSLDKNSLSLLSPGGLGTDADLVEPCVVFQDPNASRTVAKGITFSAYTSAASGLSLDGIPITVRAMKWNNVFSDMNDPAFAMDDLEELDMTEFYFEGDPQGENVTVNFDEPILLEDNQRYLFCMMTFENDLFFGYDRTIDYEENRANRYNQPLFPLNVDGQWYALGFGDNSAPAIGVNIAKFECSDINIDISGTISSDTIFIEVDGAVGSYTTSWLGAGNITPVDGMEAVVVSADGSYTVTITDENGCTETAEFNMEGIGSPCFGVNINVVGTVAGDTISITSIDGGEAPYTLTLSGPGEITDIGNNMFTVSMDGEYSLLVVDVNDCEEQDAFMVGSSNVENIEKTNIKVYPNPTNSIINFDLTGTNAENIYVFDATGRAVKTINVKSDITTFNVEEFPVGMYMFHVTSQKGNLITTDKFVISK